MEHCVHFDKSSVMVKWHGGLSLWRYSVRKVGWSGCRSECQSFNNLFICFMTFARKENP